MPTLRGGGASGEAGDDGAAAPPEATAVESVAADAAGKPKAKKKKKKAGSKSRKLTKKGLHAAIRAGALSPEQVCCRASDALQPCACGKSAEPAGHCRTTSGVL